MTSSGVSSGIAGNSEGLRKEIEQGQGGQRHSWQAQDKLLRPQLIARTKSRVLRGPSKSLPVNVYCDQASEMGS